MNSARHSGHSPGSGNRCSQEASIDVHAHYYPEAYLDLIARVGGAHGAEFVDLNGLRALKVCPLNTGPLHSRFIDLDQRIEMMDRQGVGVQALSLTQPMVYWADERFSEKMSVSYNDSL